KLIPKPSHCSHEYPTLLTLQATRHTPHLPENQKETTPAGLHRQVAPVPPGARCWAGHSLGSVWAPGGARGELCPWAGQAQSTQQAGPA
ncbi:hypothetical protein N302_07367, partial [Corvus brachyrhynchos]